MIIRRIIVELVPSPKEENRDNPPAPRILEYNRDEKLWTGVTAGRDHGAVRADGLHPGEITLIASLDKVRMTWGGDGAGE